MPKVAAQPDDQQGAAEESDGPNQIGRGLRGQYVYWICMVHPKPATVARHSVRLPGSLTRAEFRQVVIEAHMARTVEVVETAMARKETPP